MMMKMMMTEALYCDCSKAFGGNIDVATTIGELSVDVNSEKVYS